MTDTTKLLAMADRFDWRAKQLYMIDKERAELCRSDAAELRAIALEPLTGKQINDAGISRDLADLIERAIAQPAEAVEDLENAAWTCPNGHSWQEWPKHLGCPDCATHDAAIEARRAVKPAEAVEAWTVRRNESEDERGSEAYDVRLPDGSWWTCMAIGPEDARGEAVKAWEEKQVEARRYAAPKADAAQGAVAPDLQALLNGLWPKDQDTHPQAAPAHGDGSNHKLDTDTHVFFYEQDFYVLSNFSAFTLQWKGRRFDTSEAAYHYEKFHGFGHDGAEVVAHAVAAAPSAHAAFKLAENYKHLRRPDWDDVKLDVMRDILRAKAAQHEYVRRKLLATGERTLVEDSWRDDYWGWGPNRDGKNWLGRLWMEVRAELAAAPSQEGES